MSSSMSHISFFRISHLEEDQLEQTNVEKMQHSFWLEKYDLAYRYCQLVLQEVELDRRNYIEGHVFVPGNITRAINLKEAKALTLLGDMYRDGLNNIPRDLATAKAYYLKAIDELHYLEAQRHLALLSENEEHQYTNGRNI